MDDDEVLARSAPVEIRVLSTVRPFGETWIEVSTSVGDAKYVSEGSNLQIAMETLMNEIQFRPEGTELPGHIEE
jgi:hypothetical protein